MRKLIWFLRRFYALQAGVGRTMSGKTERKQEELFTQLRAGHLELIKAEADALWMAERRSRGVMRENTVTQMIVGRR